MMLQLAEEAPILVANTYLSLSSLMHKPSVVHISFHQNMTSNEISNKGISTYL
jgi:hypothetical protein